MKSIVENTLIDRTPRQKVLVLVNGKEEYVEDAEFLEKFGVSGLVRIPRDEFENINTQSESFGHFNLEKTNHEVGKRYLILKIERHGTHATTTETEQPPLLSTDGAFIVECIRVENNLPYEALTAEYFESSMKGLSDKKSLFKAIQKRYDISRRDLSREQMFNKGVGFTLFKIITKVAEQG